MKKIIAKIKKHKIISLIILLVIIGAGYYGYAKYQGGKTTVSYTTAAVEKGTLVVSVSSSGQISASNQVDITPKVSGDVTKVAVTGGQEVKAGDLIAQIDATTAYKAVRDASANLASSQLSLDKLKQAADANTVLQYQNSITTAQTALDKLKLSQPIDYQSAQNTLQTAQNTLTKAYNDAFTSISNSFLNLPTVITALNDILNSETISDSEVSLGKGQSNVSALLNSTYETDKSKIQSYQTIAENDYAAARAAYDANYSNFKSASVYSSNETIESLVAETLATAKAVAQAIKSENNYLAVWSDSRALRSSSIFAQVATYKTNLSTYSGQINTNLSSLLSNQAALQSDKEAFTTANNNIKTLKQNQPLDLVAAENSLKEKQAALVELLAGTDKLDLKAQELAVQQKRNSLLDAQTTLADYSIKAPFDGVVAAVNVKVGDTAGSSVIATIITKQQIAELSLNEVDAAKIKLGQKAIMTFDAIDGLEITGKVADLDTVGTVSQGVVTYNVQIVFDAQDSRVKSGMSTNATIITDAKTDALYVANSAVKTGTSGDKYVQTLSAAGQPQNIAVTVGIANDTSTEITSGLSQGDKVITQTINSSAAAGGSSSANKGGGFGGIRF
ncbi:MAG: efflux RND transporter periplasmic adaptor subunit [Patescibacteria group bacterium]|nr:efflux RND transporter periplasmic adaptor subunit [Patescibacteria group bacterium]